MGELSQSLGLGEVCCVRREIGVRLGHGYVMGLTYVQTVMFVVNPLISLVGLVPGCPNAHY